MSSTRFGIEWIYGEFLISRFANGESVEQWQAPYPVNDLRSLSHAMHDASAHIDLTRGGDVAIAYEDDLHTHEFLQVPRMSRRDLERHLSVRVEGSKAFDGRAAWCYHPAVPGENMEGVLLHLMPKDIVDAVTRVCGEYYLVPKRLVPLTEIISEHIKKLEAQSEDVLLIIAIFQRRMQLVVAHGDGEVLFVRELQYSSQDENIDRLVVDINRTIGYAKQRIGVRPDRAWLMGEHAPRVIGAFQGELDCPVAVDETATRTDFWTAEVAGLPQRLSSNFIPSLARRAMGRKSLMRAAVLTGWTLVAAAMLVGVVIQTVIGSPIDRNLIEQRIEDVTVDIQRVEGELHAIDLEQVRLNQLTADAFNLPALFLSHLGDMVPDGVVLHSVNIVRGEQSWRLEIEGVASQSLDRAPVVFEEFQNTLAAAPWRARITESWRTTWMQQLRSGSAAQEGDVGFRIRGTVR